MAPAIVNHTQSPVSGTQAWAPITIPATGAGNTVVVLASRYPHTSTFSSISDNATGGSNTYEQLPGALTIATDGGGWGCVDAWICKSSRAGATVITPDTDAQFGGMVVYEISGLDTDDPLDVLATHWDSGGPVLANGAPVTTTVDDAAIVSMVFAFTASTTIAVDESDTLFALDQAVVGGSGVYPNFASSHFMASGAGTYTPAFAIPSGEYLMVTVALKAGSGAPVQHEIVGSATIAVGIAAVLAVARHAALVGAVVVGISPSATLQYAQRHAIIGSAAVAVTPAATLQYQRRAAIVGAASVVIAPASTLRYQRHAAIIGSAALSIAPASTLDYTRRAAITGSVAVALSPAATLAYTQHAEIIGAATVQVVPSAAMHHSANGNYSIAGSAGIALVPAATLDYTRHAAITGSVAIGTTVAGAMQYQRHAEIIGAASISVTPSAALDYTRNAAIAGSVTVAITPAATLLYHAYSPVIAYTTRTTLVPVYETRTYLVPVYKTITTLIPR